jgi:hypothetical protein
VLDTVSADSIFSKDRSDNGEGGLMSALVLKWPPMSCWTRRAKRIPLIQLFVPPGFVSYSAPHFMGNIVLIRIDCRTHRLSGASLSWTMEETLTPPKRPLYFYMFHVKKVTYILAHHWCPCRYMLLQAASNRAQSQSWKKVTLCSWERVWIIIIFEIRHSLR